MPALCSKTLSMYVWEADSTIYPAILINHDPIAPILGGQGGTIFTTGSVYHPGKYKVEIDTAYFAGHVSFGYAVNTHRANGFCDGVPAGVNTFGGQAGSDCVSFPQVEFIGYGFVKGWTSFSGDAAAKAGIQTVGTLLEFTIPGTNPATTTAIQWRWGPVYADFCGYFCAAIAGAASHQYTITRTAKLCGS